MIESTSKLIYITDPMCSWCYGFSPEIKRIKDHFANLEFQMVMGGLRPYNTEHIIDMQNFLREHWDQVRLRSGQPFKYEILTDPNFIYDTEPPARATVVVRRFWPENEFKFFSEVQKVFYLNNRDTGKVDTYVDILKTLNLSEGVNRFKSVFDSEDARADTREDFKYAASLGVRGFPTLLLQKSSKLFLVCRGYQKAEDIIEVIEDNLPV